ncbi:MAG: tetratricopeptide repeat protein [Deltaproteobacteria bacterium]|nr:MAG: tetratricopeptide repeat protein [Deltaproteobacteria bacterium]
MKCPKCGFQQPDDLFCASCGVNVSTYRKRKSWKFALIGLLSLVIVIAAGLTFNKLRSPSKAPKPEAKVAKPLPQKPSPRERSSLRKPREARKKRTPRRFEPAVQLQRPVEKIEDKEPDSENTQEIREETPAKTAMDWFNEGVSLSNDSPEEINCYRQAIKLDPTLAVAHYNLGVIYHSQGKESQSKSQFRNFLRHATDDEIRELPVESYYPLESIAESSEEAAEEEPGEVRTEEVTEVEVEEAEEEVEEEAEEEEEIGEEEAPEEGTE